ncbi:MAG: AAA family ATPase, partial [Myxococcota bacterium]
MTRTKSDHVPWLSNLLTKRLWINIGKGGVGKSTVSALMAMYAAEHGKRVLICEIGSKSRMSELFGVKRTDVNELDQIGSLTPLISSVHMQSTPAMKEYIVRVLRMRLLYKLVFEHRWVKYFLRA